MEVVGARRVLDLLVSACACEQELQRGVYLDLLVSARACMAVRLEVERFRA